MSYAVQDLRTGARNALLGRREVELPEAREMHQHAVELGDDEAVALWSRVIWRLLVDLEEYRWLAEPLPAYLCRETGAHVTVLLSRP